MRFTKMHGCGNDYVYIDAWEERLPADLPALARAVSDRHTGVGADGLIAIGPSAVAAARMQMWNADGSVSEMCGNGIRCAVKLALDHHRVAGDEVRVETGAGILTVAPVRRDGAVWGARVSMGRPRLAPAAVPVDHPGPGPLLELHLDAAGARHRLLAVGMGNPHAVCFVDHPERFPVTEVGAALEVHPAFPRRANIEFVARLPDERGQPVLRQRTWERGSGETLACGTGACAATVAAILDRRIPGRSAIVRLSGGDLEIAWPADDAEVVMTGPAVTVFEGRWPG